MSDQYYGEIRMFAGWGGQLCIKHWAFCNGTTLSINDNQALFSLIGTIWGGDGRTTFQLPDMRGRIPIHQGTGAGLTPRIFGQMLGLDDVVITEDQMPSHDHPLQASSQGAATDIPTQAVPATVTPNTFYDDQAGSVKTAKLSGHAVGSTGNSDSHENCMPTMTLSYIIALAGIYPERHPQNIQLYFPCKSQVLTWLFLCPQKRKTTTYLSLIHI
eukprot:TRINITY_DN9563_c0_g1_i2.p3 TRINITY_DN9563_c0_g1~~TRINITY_DN9563_c0_g1_i2.p3  ORF type:complete len:215 (+),score=-14.90 TRINITY_DN9563_c0_g1_i2:681-1325(+)